MISVERFRQSEALYNVPVDVLIINTTDNQSSGIERTTFESQTPQSQTPLSYRTESVLTYDSSETTVVEQKSYEMTEAENTFVPVEVETMTVLASMLESEEFETGIANPSESFFQKLFVSNSIATLNGLSTLFMNHFSLDGKSVHILSGILHILSHFPYVSVYPLGQMMAINALNHESRQVEEFGIKCFENWGHPDGAEKLRAVRFAASWLQEYAEEVISELTEG